MDMIAQIPLIGGLLSTLLPFIVMISVVVFIHEYGHYIVGRWCGIKAETFSIGFGKVLVKWQDKRGTQWQIAALPLGGYVKFLGDADGSSRTDHAALAGMDTDTRNRSFPGAALWKRALTVLAGPVANFILSIVVFAFLVLWTGVAADRPVVDRVVIDQTGRQDLRPGDLLLEVNGQEVANWPEIRAAFDAAPATAEVPVLVERAGTRVETFAPYLYPALVSGLTPVSPAGKAGIRKGDVVRAAGGEPVTSFNDLRLAVIANGAEPLPLVIDRDGEEISLTLVPEFVPEEQADGTFTQRPIIGVEGAPVMTLQTRTPGPIEALSRGVEGTWGVATGSLNAIRHIILGNLSATNLQGPVGIAKMSGHYAQKSTLDYISLLALISTSIGLLNLFPVPVLDGGHLLMFGYEAVAGKPPSERFLQFAMSLGLAMVLLLMVYATYNDILRL